MNETDAAQSEEQARIEAARRQAIVQGLPLMLGLGIVLVLLSVYVLAFLLPDTLASIQGPQAMTMAEAGADASDTRLYASLTDGEWDCATRREVRGFSPSSLRYGRPSVETRSTEIFYVNAARDAVALVVLSGSVECVDLESQVPSGYVYAMEDGLRQTLTNDARLARYFDADTFLEVCGYCGYDNSLLGVILGILFGASGIGLLILRRRLARTYKPRLAEDDPAA
jgi:hypothetical protein